MSDEEAVNGKEVIESVIQGRKEVPSCQKSSRSLPPGSSSKGTEQNVLRRITIFIT
jgi:hypothetical protein